MNEQLIKELANKAGVDAGQMIANIICGDDEFKALGNEFNKLSQETRDYIYKVIEQNQEKFAELIVRECADYISETATIETLLGERLKEHFGVEE